MLRLANGMSRLSVVCLSVVYNVIALWAETCTFQQYFWTAQ